MERLKRWFGLFQGVEFCVVRVRLSDGRVMRLCLQAEVDFEQEK